MNYFYHIATTVLGLSLILVKKILCHQEKKKRKTNVLRRSKKIPHSCILCFKCAIIPYNQLLPMPSDVEPQVLVMATEMEQEVNGQFPSH